MNETKFTVNNDEPSLQFRIFLIIIFVIILLIGFIGNGFVLLSIIINRIKIRRSTTNLLLVNMAIADLIILTFNVIDIGQFSFDKCWPTAWYLGSFLCKLVRFGQVFGCYVSVQTLLVISIERYISIVHAIKMSPIDRRKRFRLVFILIWSLGFIAALPNLYLLKLHPFHNRPNHYVCGLSDHWIDSRLIIVYKYTESIVFFFFPALIQSILYAIICYKIFSVGRTVQAQFNARQLRQSIFSDYLPKYSDTRLSSSTPSPLINHNYNMSLSPVISLRYQPNVIRLTTNNGNIARKKAIIMLLIIAIVYFVAFSPVQINFIYTQINQSHHLFEHRLFFIITILLALSSTAVNPILFYIFSKYFRYKFNSLLRHLCHTCRSGTKIENNYPMI